MKTSKIEYIPNDISMAFTKEIFNQCLVALSRRSSKIQLFVPGEVKASQSNRRLCGRKSPLGEIIADTDGGQLVVFYVSHLMEWLQANGTIKISEVNNDQETPGRN